MGDSSATVSTVAVRVAVSSGAGDGVGDKSVTISTVTIRVAVSSGAGDGVGDSSVAVSTVAVRVAVAFGTGDGVGDTSVAAGLGVSVGKEVGTKGVGGTDKGVREGGIVAVTYRRVAVGGLVIVRVTLAISVG